ncbi:hypothetical protein T484DRAFT_1835259 [Baffinella frigidus]|nr:hypothetical protein T484DRAFT_1835259 [Cryptophyta sp. CCMP2293]
MTDRGKEGLHVVVPNTIYGADCVINFIGSLAIYALARHGRMAVVQGEWMYVCLQAVSVMCSAVASVFSG